MRRRSIVLSMTLSTILASVASMATAAADDPAPSGTGAALLEALARVPDTAVAPGSPVSYLDQETLVATRPGAAQPASIAEALALLEADDPAASLWLAAFMGASSGDAGLVQGLVMAGGWPQVVGFDLLDVDRHLSFGTPPSDGSVLLGAFDPQAIADALAARGYTASEAGDRVLLCGAAGCDAGMDVDLARADRSLPFGGEIGRSEPLAISGQEILNSADLATLEAMLAAADGEADSLADDPAYRALALAGDPAVPLIQATFLPGGMLGLGPDIYRLLGGSPEAATELLTRLDETFEPMPAADAVAILDGATDSEQVVTIALAYADEADAAIAAEVLPRRLETLPAASYEAALAELLADRGVTSVAGSVLPAGEGTSAVARIEVRAPLADSEVDAATGQPAPSSSLYRLFIDLVQRRDLLWLVPVLPLE
jgi:hypothetical protein